MEECWPGRLPRDSAREEERRRLPPHSTPETRCYGWTGAQVGSQRTVAGVPSFSQKGPFISACANSKVTSPPAKVPPQPHVGTFRAASRSPSMGGEARRNPPNTGMASRSALPSRQVALRGPVAEPQTDKRVRKSEVSVPAAGQVVNKLFGNPGAVRAGSSWFGRVHVTGSVVSNHVDYASASSVSPGSASHCLPLTTHSAAPVSPVFAPSCLWQGVARHVLDLWTGMKDPLLQLTHRTLINHSSAVTGRPPRDLLPISFLSCEQSFGTSQCKRTWQCPPHPIFSIGGCWS